MSKVKQLDLRKQEVVDECDEMRWENEGIGLSDVQVKIVEYAFMQGFHAAGDVLGHPIQENIVPDNDNQTVIEEIARVALGMVFDEIGHELDLSDDELLRVRDYLEAKLEQDDEEELEDKCITCDTPIVFGGCWGYCKPCLREYATKRLPEIKAKIQREQDDE